MHKSATKCNETIGKWYKNKHGVSKIIDTFETYHCASQMLKEAKEDLRRVGSRISWRSRACLLVVARKAKTNVSNANVLDIEQRGVL
jgi:hypothetical protein